MGYGQAKRINRRLLICYRRGVPLSHSIRRVGERPWILHFSLPVYLAGSAIGPVIHQKSGDSWQATATRRNELYKKQIDNGQYSQPLGKHLRRWLRIREMTTLILYKSIPREPVDKGNGRRRVGPIAILRFKNHNVWIFFVIYGNWILIL